MTASIAHRTHDVPTAEVLRAMERRWQGYGNIVTTPLRETWEQITKVFNRKLSEAGTQYARDWHVLSPATGTGKTETAIVYAASLPRFTPAGMLIVTRYMLAADRLAREINVEAGAEVAIAHHHVTPIPPAVMRKFPVLVITHVAFERAVERVDGGRVWDHFAAFGDERRDLVVIDESVDLLEITTLTEDALSFVLGSIPGEARALWPTEVRYLEELLAELRRWVATIREQPAPNSQRVMRDAARAQFDALFGNLPDFTALRDFMCRHWHIGSAKHGTKAATNSDLHKNADKVFGQVEELVRSFVLLAHKGKGTTFNSARMILPEDAQGCVILDATASVNRFYNIVSSEDGSFTIHRHAPPVGARNYRNVSLRIARVSATGKGALTRETDDGSTVGAREAVRVLAWSAVNLAHHKEVLIACHKDNALHFTAAQGLPFVLKVGTYGSTDGSNEFRDCTASIVFGLPWRDPVDASLTFFATQGVQPDSWLRNDAAREFRGYSDIRDALYLGWVATDLVQIVNRPAMRRVIDEQGNCPPCELFVLLPKGPRGDYILSALLAQLPGLVDIAPWDFTLTPKSARIRVDYSEKLKAWAHTLEKGDRVPVKFVREQLGCSPTSWERLATSLKDDTSDLTIMLRSFSVRYSVEQVGSHRQACIVRD